MRRVPWLTLACAGVILLVQAVPELLAAGEWQRGGEWQRMLSCHFTHWSWDHLGWNLGMLLVLGIPCELADRRRLAFAISASLVTIPLAVMLWQPALLSYRGFSGVASALFSLLLVLRWRDGFRWVTGFLGLAFLGKIVYELVAGTALFADSAAAGFVPVPLAHAVGALCGWAFVGRRRSTKTLA
jgi:rhomboid family GlyGly-CTERM serine protease